MAEREKAVAKWMERFGYKRKADSQVLPVVNGGSKIDLFRILRGEWLMDRAR